MSFRITQVHVAPHSVLSGTTNLWGLVSAATLARGEWYIGEVGVAHAPGQCSGCGKYHYAQTPDSVPSGQMGPNLVALIAHLSGRYHLSIRHIQDYLVEHWHLQFSLGAISQAQANKKHINLCKSDYAHILPMSG